MSGRNSPAVLGLLPRTVLSTGELSGHLMMSWLHPVLDETWWSWPSRCAPHTAVYTSRSPRTRCDLCDLKEKHSPEICITQRASHLCLHFISCFLGEGGLAISLLFFLDLFWNRTFGISGTGLYGPDALPVSQSTMSKYWRNQYVQSGFYQLDATKKTNKCIDLYFVVAEKRTTTLYLCIKKH